MDVGEEVERLVGRADREGLYIAKRQEGRRRGLPF